MHWFQSPAGEAKSVPERWEICSLKCQLLECIFQKQKRIYIYIDTCMYIYIYKEIGVQKLHISTYISTYSSSIWSWVNNHQALFKPQGGVSKPSYAHRHIGPSNPYVQKILCLFIYLFRGFFLMGTSISPSVGRCLPLVFFCAKKKKA